MIHSPTTYDVRPTLTDVEDDWIILVDWGSKNVLTQAKTKLFDTFARYRWIFFFRYSWGLGSFLVKIKMDAYQKLSLLAYVLEDKKEIDYRTWFFSIAFEKIVYDEIIKSKLQIQKSLLCQDPCHAEERKSVTTSQCGLTTDRNRSGGTECP